MLAGYNALRRLHDRGLTTRVSMEPYPTPNLVKQDLNKILNKISFVDKIIFGKLNYGVKVTEFANNKDFYEERADTVIDFCKQRGIDYHIKHGTKKKDDKKTRKIFQKCAPVNPIRTCSAAQASFTLKTV